MKDEDYIVCPACRRKVAVVADFDGEFFFFCKKCLKQSERFKATEKPDDICQICVRWKE